MIPYGRQEVSEADVEAVVAVLRSDYLTQGPVVPRFEGALADYAGARHAVAANSATSALHLACLALDVGPGDVVWTSPITFVASANCALYCGADVDFVDVDPATGNMCVDDLAARLEAAEGEGRLPRVVIPVHLAGRPVDLPRVAELARRYGFRIVEDASHAVGARSQGVPVGACTHSDICVFSFHPVKIVTTGEGGAALTNDEGLARRMARLRSHGITRNEAEMREPAHGPWYYQQLELGFNYRMTDLQAALGLSQLQRLDAYVERRHELARRYDVLLAEAVWPEGQGAARAGSGPHPVETRGADAAPLPTTPLETPPPVRAGDRSALHLYPIKVEADRRRRVFELLREGGVGANVHYIPVHTQPYYRERQMGSGPYPGAEAYYARTLSLPLYPTLTEAEQDRVVEVLARAVHRAPAELPA